MLHVLSEKDKGDVKMFSYRQQTPWWSITSDSLKTELQARHCLQNKSLKAAHK